MEIDFKAECHGGDLVESLAGRCGEPGGGRSSARRCAVEPVRAPSVRSVSVQLSAPASALLPPPQKRTTS